MRRPPARRPRRVAVVLILGATAACADDGPGAAAVAVVSVAARRCDRPLPSEGVGLVAGPGLVVTAAHVVDGPRREVLVDGRPGQVVAVDARTDLALVAVDVGGRAATFGEPSAGDVRVITPIGERPAVVVRTGTLVVDDLSARRRHRRQAHTVRPGVDAGTSGAPVVDDAGRVLGIVVLDNPTDGTAYAVTAGELQQLLRTHRVDGVGPTAPPCPG